MKSFSGQTAAWFAITSQTTDLESMELLAPRPLIIAWQIFYLALFAIALILTSKRMDAGRKIVWLIATMCLPVLGPILLFVAFKRGHRAEVADNM